MACAPSPSSLESFGTAEIELGSVPLTVVVAETSAQLFQGLRGVETLPEGVDGMLFVLEEARSATFTMRDTLIPLDIWWFDADGRLVGRTEMEPCASEPCPRYRSPVAVRWALETPSGEWDFVNGSVLVVVS